MSTNRVRSAALVLSALVAWPLFSISASAAMLLSSTANPSTAAAGERVRYAVTVSNTGPSVQSVALTAVVPVSTKVARTELSLGAYCDGVGGTTTCAAGQTLQFVGFNVPAGGSVTVVYPALVNSSAAPPNGTLLNSDLWVQDQSTGDDYQLNVAAVAGLKTIITGPVSQTPD